MKTEPSPDAKQAAELETLHTEFREAHIWLDERGAPKVGCNAPYNLRARIQVFTAKLREELGQMRGDVCKLLAFANLVEPYVSNDHCHGKSELDHKLYDACFEIRPLIAKWTRSYIEGEQELAHQQPSEHWTVTEPAAGHFRLEYGNEVMAETDDSSVFHKWCDAVMQTNPEIPEQPSAPPRINEDCTCDIDTVCKVHGGPSAPTAEICAAYKEHGVNDGKGCGKPKGHEGNHGN